MSTTQSATMPWMSWWPMSGPPPWWRPVAHSTAARGARSAAPVGRAGIITRASPDGPPGDHQALPDEPVARELVALPDVAEDRVDGELDAVEGELGVLV